jgi:glycosyltransferase involved in cell wall biosynthesis
VRRASAIYLSSKAEAAAFGRLGLPFNFGVVPNGFEKDWSGSTPAIPIPAKPYVLFLGYLDPRKQPDFLVRAFAQSRARATHMLVLAGPDAYGFRSELEREVDRAGVGEHTLFVGPVYGASKWALLENACCLCLPSKAEGFPLVLAEALGAGIPSIYSMQCNFPEAASAGAGLEITNFGTESWLQAIEMVCLDNDLNHKMRLAAQALAPRYSWSRIAQEWLSVYRGLSHSL